LASFTEWGGQLPSDAIVCFANTGKEDEATLRFVQDCSERWNVPITWLEFCDTKSKFEIVDFYSASRNGKPFETLIKKKSFLPNSVMRFCTGELKILTIERYFKSLGMDEFDTMVGIRADEPKRIVKMRDTKLMPLAQAGVAQSDVQAFWKSHDFDLGLSFRNGVTADGNCDLCFMKPMHQVLSMVAEKPEKAIWWATQEKLIGGRFSKDRPTYKQMINYTKDQIDMFNPNEEAIACFCGD
jgi:3'-phosphoadenosine 5'-phosphosulfate sulfotransferase (PAPS reductase)/FAD synthetase